MNTLTRLAAALPLSCLLLAADPITSSVIDANGNFANLSVNLIVSADPSAYTQVQGAGRAIFDGRPVTQISNQLSWSQSLSTSGPARAGFIQITLSDTGANDNGDGYGMVSMPPALNGQSIDASCATAYNGCWGNSPGAFNHYGLLPFQLGQQFTLAYSSEIYAYSDSGGEGGYAGFTMDYGFRLFEADRSTPVAISAISPAPEPSSLFLIALGVALIGAKYARQLIHRTVDSVVRFRTRVVPVSG